MRPSIFTVCTLIASACAATVTPDTDQPDTALNSAAVIRAHMGFLADDLLEGRDAGSRGEALSALYIAKTYERLGLQPLAGNGSYIQPVPLRSAQLDLGSVRFEVSRDTHQQSFRNGDDIFVWAHLSEAEIDVSAPLVFVGHGIIAPEFDINDYDGLDVEGKVVVVLGGPPPFLPSAEAAHFGSTSVKQRFAADAGAVGLIRMWTPSNEAQVPFNLLKSVLRRPDVTWIGPNDEVKDAVPEIVLRATVRGSAADAIFAGAPMSSETVLAEGARGPVTGFPLKTEVSLTLSTRHDDSLVSGNVAGFLPGADPLLQQEVVVVTAHYDHVGICQPLSSDDTICNGALDNALGTAAMMDVARRVATSPEKPGRSILFLAVGAEEKGLLGSDYFTAFPTLGDREIVANLNMDGGFPFYDFSDVIAFGAEQSTLGDMLAEAIAPMNLTVSPDPFPEQSIFTRSDQYSFVKAGVPALFLYNGFTDLNGENVGLAIWNGALANNYHQPSDDLSLPINYDFAAKYADVFYRLTRHVADSEKRPKWYSDSLFGKIYSPDSQKAARSPENSKPTDQS